ncbi:MAG: pyruvate:ferredoxin (flavodoxin) oxidoreductase, partial [Chlamydiia bacterium]|nr:pyruvate:ferredoxin (flavodoxin) oxidoreductase [Chlamydiia bacterium]
IAMGSVTETIKEVIDYKVAQGEKIGLITVHLYRPFSEKYFRRVLPDTVNKICVLDRTKEPGANGEPLYLDVRDIFYGEENCPLVIGGRYGLSSKDTTPAQMAAVYDNLNLPEPKNRFTVGITDDVTFLSIPVGEALSLAPKGTFEGLFYGLGADGTVGANKNSIKIIGDNTDKYAQAYFAYDSKKSGGFTASHLRFGDEPIRSTYLVTTPEFVACHVPAYLNKYDMLSGIKENGVFLMNSPWSIEETKNHLPAHMKKTLAEKNISMYMINATEKAKEIGLGNRTNTIMQSAFFKVADVVPYELAVEQMKKLIVKSYGNKGEKIVNMNYAAVDNGGDVIKVDIPAEWAKLDVVAEQKKVDESIPAFIRDIVQPVNDLKGDSLPVSVFTDREDGTFEPGTAAYEKRGIAVDIPEWIADNCIQCNQCAYVCPHAAIRPFLLDDNEAANTPEGVDLLGAKGKEIKDLKFRIQISALDCTGCNNCVAVCPSKEKSLVMKPIESQMVQADNWDYMIKNVSYKTDRFDKTKNVKNSQFEQPLFEFSGACSGCGETPYIKAITQLFGDRMTIANATGCSSIYGGSAPSTPYCTNSEDEGPAWANSLFEDNA